MLALVMVFGNVQRDCEIGRTGEAGFGAEQDAAEGEPGDVFKDVGVLDGFSGSFAPGERGVAGDEDTGDGDGVKGFQMEAADDDGAGVAHVACGDFLSGEGFGDGNG